MKPTIAFVLAPSLGACIVTLAPTPWPTLSPTRDPLIPEPAFDKDLDYAKGALGIAGFEVQECDIDFDRPDEFLETPTKCLSAINQDASITLHASGEEILTADVLVHRMTCGYEWFRDLMAYTGASDTTIQATLGKLYDEIGELEDLRPNVALCGSNPKLEICPRAPTGETEVLVTVTRTQ